MNLVKLQCNTCGAALDVKPWMSIIKCEYCGMSYAVEKDTTEKDVKTNNTNDDNPANIKISPIDVDIVDFKYINAPYNWENIISNEVLDFVKTLYSNLDCNDKNANSRNKNCAYYYYPPLLNKEDEGMIIEANTIKLQHRIKLFAALSYLNNESYDLNIGSYILNIRPCRREFLKGFENPTPTVLEADLDKYVEPNVYPKSESLNPLDQKNIVVQYNKKDREKDSKYREELSLKLIKKFNLKYRDEEKYTFSRNRLIHKHALISSKPYSIYEGWITRFTERNLSLQINSQNAKDYLNDTDLNLLDKIGNKKCLTEICDIINRNLHTNLEQQLNNRKYKIVYLSIFDSYVSIGDERINFKTFGMEDINDDTIKVFLMANILKNTIKEFDNKFKIGYSLIDAKSLTVGLAPTIKTEAEYDKWV